MTAAIWMRCLLVSACFALVVPILTATIFVPIGPDETLPDLSLIEPGELEYLDSDEAIARVATLPTLKLSLSGRILYPFSHPQALRFYVRGVAISFLYIFAATSIVAYGIATGRSAT